MTISTSAPWEAGLANWSSEGMHGELVSPEHVLKLLLAESEEGATSAYWRLDGVVCENGLLAPAALATVQMLLGQLPRWTVEAKPFCLELLGQIAAAEPREREASLRDACYAELRQAAWYFFNGLQFDTAANVPFHVDLVGLLCAYYADLREKGRAYLTRTLHRDLPAEVLELIRATAAELG